MIQSGCTPYMILPGSYTWLSLVAFLRYADMHIRPWSELDCVVICKGFESHRKSSGFLSYVYSFSVPRIPFIGAVLTQVKQVHLCCICKSTYRQGFPNHRVNSRVNQVQVFFSLLHVGQSSVHICMNALYLCVNIWNLRKRLPNLGFICVRYWVNLLSHLQHEEWLPSIF